MLTNRIVLGLVSAAILIGFLLYRSCAPDTSLNIDPHASKEIEKAKRR